VTICAATDRFFARLPVAMDMPELLEDERFARRAHRAANTAEIHAVVWRWTADLSVAGVTKRLMAADIPVSVVHVGKGQSRLAGGVLEPVTGRVHRAARVPVP
jgi:crotonobetainyl-CoA:carnitine CoA-transferase CaiB-like acyl-CoA transferase